jgi:hypothetical protein
MEAMVTRNKGLSVAVLAVAMVLAGPTSGQAGYLSATFTLSASNVLPDGNYGSVFIESYNGPNPQDLVHHLLAGQVRMTVTAPFLSIYGSPDNYGMDKFGFNTDLNLSPNNIVVTDGGGTNLGWTVTQKLGVIKPQNISTFGTFSVEDDGTGHSRGDPIVVTIGNLGSNATIDHFIFLSTGGGGPDAYFVAHLGGFTAQPTSQFIAVTSLTPEPGTIGLALIGLAGIGVARLRRRFARSRTHLAAP